MTEALSAKVTLGSGTNTVGTENTSLKGFSFTGTGSNLIKGKDLINGSVKMGSEGKKSQLLVTGVMENSTVTLTGGENIVGGITTSFKNTKISGVAPGVNTIQASGMTGGSITLGESDDKVDIFGDIDSASINLGTGLNLLRNTLATDEADMESPGQGTVINNSVRNSTIVTGDRTNIYLGDVKDGTRISGMGTNNINLGSLTDSSIDASGMRDGYYIGVGTAENGAIQAGVRGSINVNTLDGGNISDLLGQNSITVGNLGETASISTGEAIYSTKIHVNNLNGTLDLGNHNYGGLKRDNLTFAASAYAGTVKISGERVDGAGVEAPAKDTSGFGIGAGSLLV